MSVPILGQPEPELRELDGSGPSLRVLFCRVCDSLEELPPFEGHPEDDVLLEVSVEKHQSAGIPHTGHLFVVPVKFWSEPKIRMGIIQQIKGGSGGLDELQQGYYDSKSTFAEAAMRCYSKHLRPKGACPDWRSDKKRILPDTAAERRAAGLPKPSEGAPKVWECSFCPVSTYMLTKHREETGQYA